MMSLLLFMLAGVTSVNALREHHGELAGQRSSFCWKHCCRSKCDNFTVLSGVDFRYENCTVKVNAPIQQGDERFCEETCKVSLPDGTKEVKAMRKSQKEVQWCQLQPGLCQATPTCSGHTYELKSVVGTWQFKDCFVEVERSGADMCVETCTVLHTNESQQVFVIRDLFAGQCRLADPGLQEFAMDFVEQLEKTALALPIGKYRGLPLIRHPSAIKRFLSHLKKEVLVPEKQAAEGQGWSREITARYVAIIGDLHGQLFNLIAWLIYIKEQYQDKGFSKLEGSSLLICDPQLKYVFLGDYVDRGERGLEVLLLLLAYKARCPEGLVLLQGNHEMPAIWDRYGFKAELWYKVKMRPSTVRDVVQHLPYVAVLPGKYMFVHGGLSPEFVKKCRGKAGRFGTCLDEETAFSLTWADPHDGKGWLESPRGIGHKFGMDIAKQFLESNDLHAIWRGHEQIERGGETRSLQGYYVFTVFSAADYVGVFCLNGRRPVVAPAWDPPMFHLPGEDNSGAVVVIDSEQNLSSTPYLRMTGNQTRQIAAEFTGAQCSKRSLLEEGSQVLESPDLESRDLESFMQENHKRLASIGDNASCSLGEAETNSLKEEVRKILSTAENREFEARKLIDLQGEALIHPERESVQICKCMKRDHVTLEVYEELQGADQEVLDMDINTREHELEAHSDG